MLLGLHCDITATLDHADLETAMLTAFCWRSVQRFSLA
jgi:hypothetical protein